MKKCYKKGIVCEDLQLCIWNIFDKRPKTRGPFGEKWCNPIRMGIPSSRWCPFRLVLWSFLGLQEKLPFLPNKNMLELGPGPRNRVNLGGLAYDEIFSPNKSTNHKSLDWQCPHIQYPWPLGPPFSRSLRDCLSGKGPKSTSQQGNKTDTKLVVFRPFSSWKLWQLMLGQWTLRSWRNHPKQRLQKHRETTTFTQAHPLQCTLWSWKNSTCCASKKRNSPKWNPELFPYHPWQVGWSMKVALHRHQEKKLELVAWNHLEG